MSRQIMALGNKQHWVKQDPFFTVVIATFNRAELVIRALNSLISQSETDWEAVIVDDGSSDNTGERLKPYLMKYSNVTMIRQEKEGAVPAKNRGIRNARGRFITFLDSDDEYLEDHLGIRREVIQNNPGVRLLYGGATVNGGKYVPDRFDNTRVINLNECVIGGTIVIERDTALALNGLRDLKIGSDADLFDRALKMGIVPLKVDEPTYIYNHDSPDSVTNSLLAGEQF